MTLQCGVERDRGDEVPVFQRPDRICCSSGVVQYCTYIAEGWLVRKGVG